MEKKSVSTVLGPASKIILTLGLFITPICLWVTVIGYNIGLREIRFKIPTWFSAINIMVVVSCMILYIPIIKLIVKIFKNPQELTNTKTRRILLREFRIVTSLFILWLFLGIIGTYSYIHLYPSIDFLNNWAYRTQSFLIFFIYPLYLLIRFILWAMRKVRAA